MVDCVVVGGGIIGCSIAWRLSRARARVVVVDARTAGAEASTAGAGMLAPGGEFDEPTSAARTAVESAALYPDFVDELTSVTGLNIDYRRCGGLDLARDEAEFVALRTRIHRQRSLGITAEMREEGAFYPNDALVDPTDMMAALIAACTARGVLFRENQAVERIAVSGRDIEVATPIGIMPARTAVLAAGAWSSSIVIDGVPAVPRSYPVRGHLLGYELPPGVLPHIVRHGHTYVLQRSSGFTIAGATSERVGFDRSVDPVLEADVAARASEIVPELRGVQPVRTWIGFRPAVDGEPAVGQWHRSRLWLAYGHYRNGILLAPHTAREIAGGIIASLERD